MAFDQYASVANMKLCESVFQRYMRDKYDVVIPAADARVKRILWKIMQDIKNQPPKPGMTTLRQLNDMTLNIARDVYMAASGRQPDGGALAPSIRPTAAAPYMHHNDSHRSSHDSHDTHRSSHDTHDTTNDALTRGAPPQSLDRDRALYGSRPVAFNNLVPQSTVKGDDDSVNGTFEKLMLQRRQETEPDAQPDVGLATEKVDPVQSDEMAKMLLELEQARGADDDKARLHAPPPPTEQVEARDLHSKSNAMLDDRALIRAPEDPALIYRSFDRGADAAGASIHTMVSSAKAFGHAGDVTLDDGEEDSNLRVLQPLPRDANRRVVHKYVAINSFDRNWFQDPFRNTYTVSFAGYGENDAQHQYRNITALAVTKVVLPMEITERPTLNTNAVSRTEFINDYSFNYPYVMICLEGIDDVYDGTNDRIRRAFCMLVFNTSYRTKNGRGFVVLDPIQEEKKLFYPVPMGNLRNLKITLIRPNGAVLNNSTDDYLVSKVEYEDYNPAHLRVVLDKFFDKNDYYVGDTVLIKGYVAQEIDPLAGMEAWSYQRVNDFINRPEGHEVVELGQVNENGFYRTFYIMGPGTLDKVGGKLAIDQALITTLNSFNMQQQAEYALRPDLYNAVTNGGICNVSLQNTVSLTLWYEIFDPKTDQRTN